MMKSFKAGAQERPSRIAGAVLLLAVGALYLPVIFNQFLIWDDDMLLAMLNRSIPFFENGVREGVPFHYPIFLAWLYLLKGLFGTSALAFHVPGLLFHLINVGLLFSLVIRLSAVPGRGCTRAAWVGGLVAALFWGLNPLRAEPVAWMASSVYLMAATWSLVAAHFYVAARGGLRWNLYAFAFFYLLAVSTHPSALLLVVFLIAIDWLTVGLNPRQRLIYVGMIGIAVASAVLMIYLKSKNYPALGHASSLSLYRELTKAIGFVGDFSLLHGVWPNDIRLMYFPYSELSWAEWPFIGGALLFIGIVFVGLVSSGPRKKIVLSWAACHVAFCLPVSGMGVSDYMPADRFLYLPALIDAVFVGMLVNTIDWAVGSSRLRVAAVFIVMVVGFSGAQGLRLHAELKHWKSTETLMERSIETAKTRAMELDAKSRLVAYKINTWSGVAVVDGYVRRLAYIKNTDQLELLGALSYTAQSPLGCKVSRRLFSLVVGELSPGQYQEALAVLQGSCPGR